MLDHKTSLNKFKKIIIISSMFSDHDGVKLEINYKWKTGKITNMWRLNNKLLKPMGQRRNQRENQKIS